jgi:hypothetical protein
MENEAGNEFGVVSGFSQYNQTPKRTLSKVFFEIGVVLLFEYVVELAILCTS